MIKAGVTKLAMVQAPTDALLGASLPVFADAALLFPLTDFRSDELSLKEASIELRDAMCYAQGTPVEAARAVARRFLLSKRKYNDTVTLLAEIDGVESRVLQMERLSSVACPGRHGRRVMVPASEWPGFACAENNGQGWTCDIVSYSARHTAATVAFVEAVTARGLPYADVDIRLHVLAPL